MTNILTQAEITHIEDQCNKYGITDYTINNDGSVDVNGDVYLKHNGLTELPLVFNKVSGYFDCSYNELSSLYGSPRIVDDFDCSNNSLINLEGSPDVVTGIFICSDNNLTSLNGCPRNIGRSFSCASNYIKTLKGGPDRINGYLNIKENELTSLEGIPLGIDRISFAYNHKLPQDILLPYNKLDKELFIIFCKYYTHYDVFGNDGKIIEAKYKELIDDIEDGLL